MEECYTKKNPAAYVKGIRDKLLTDNDNISTDPGEEGPGFMSFFKEKASASVPETQCKWPHHQILREGDFDGL